MSSEVDAWILSRRPARVKLDPYLPYEYFVEEERVGRRDRGAGCHCIYY